ncbi:unnamed protein product [Larinioides sclopetarius]|uniref:Uncharacterized protein n=1 Tax=Larinioides sclopetarius TaxID=280406 RepID=A0AAV1YSY0_9ARAC
MIEIKKIFLKSFLPLCSSFFLFPKDLSNLTSTIYLETKPLSIWLLLVFCSLFWERAGWSKPAADGSSGKSIRILDNDGFYIIPNLVKFPTLIVPNLTMLTSVQLHWAFSSKDDSCGLLVFLSRVSNIEVRIFHSATNKHERHLLVKVAVSIGRIACYVPSPKRWASEFVYHAEPRYYSFVLLLHGPEIEKLYLGATVEHINSSKPSITFRSRCHLKQFSLKHPLKYPLLGISKTSLVNTKLNVSSTNHTSVSSSHFFTRVSVSIDRRCTRTRHNTPPLVGGAVNIFFAYNINPCNGLPLSKKAEENEEFALSRKLKTPLSESGCEVIKIKENKCLPERFRKIQSSL